MKTRCVLDNITFQPFMKMWIREPNIPQDKRMRLLCRSCCAKAAPTIVLHNLYACHRCHLSSVLDMRWPNGIISNKDLYVCCGTGLLSQQVRRIRRSMLGHMLLIPMDTPAQLTLQVVVAGSNRYRAHLADTHQHT